jgi:hypothetical protein
MENETPAHQGQNAQNNSPALRPVATDGKFSTTVNGTPLSFGEAMPSGRHILGKAGFEPPGEYLLIQLLTHSTRSVGLDDTVDLRLTGTEAFRAFRSDRLFLFTFNDHGYEWGETKIPEPQLRELCHVREDEVIVLERDEDNIDLKPDDVLDLADAGTEHLHTEKRLITVYFENKPFEMPRGRYTTEQLKHRFGVQPGYVLEVINHEGQLTPLKPGEHIRVKDGMKFFEQVPCGASS